MAGRLAGRAALITGAGSGMGRAMALEFAHEGAAIAAVDLNQETAEATAKAVVEAGGRAVGLSGDVSDATSVARFTDAALGELGRVDILCNNAGILDDYKPVLETTEELWDRILGVNLKGMFLVSRALLPQMLERGSGVIINTASIAGMVAGGGGAAYTASKHGVIGLTRQLAFDYGPRGIRANAICPGAVETGMTKDIFTNADLNVMETVNSVPAGRHAQPEEIAKLALYLAGDDSSFIHGAAVVIDGGWTVS